MLLIVLLGMQIEECGCDHQFFSYLGGVRCDECCRLFCPYCISGKIEIAMNIEKWNCFWCREAGLCDGDKEESNNIEVEGFFVPKLDQFVNLISIDKIKHAAG